MADWTMVDLWDDPDFQDAEREPVVIDFVRVLHETEAAWKLLLTEADVFERIAGDSDNGVWFPKSQCVLKDDECLIVVPAWLAIEKGLV